MNDRYFREGRFSFDFEKSLSASKADLPYLNGLGGVDFVVELEDRFIFVEVKDLDNKRVPSNERLEWIEKLKITKDNPFLNDLGVKFKDTVLRKWAKNVELDKPVYYIIILQFDAIDALQKTKLAEDLSGKLPTCINEKYGFCKNLQIKRREILSVEEWQDKYSEFPVKEVG
jgi:hypothetical protein